MTHLNESLRKAAVLIAALDVDAADAVLERLAPEQAALLRRVMIELPLLAAGEEDFVIGEFLGRDTRQVAASREASDVELELSRPSTMPARLSLYRPEPTNESPTFQFLQDAADEDLAELFAGERPQTVALVVSHLSADLAARTLSRLPDELQTEVVRRLARLDEADPLVVREVEAAFERRYRRQFRPSGGKAAGVGAVRRILEEAAPETRGQWLTTLGRNDPPLAALLSREPVGFDELERLTDDSLSLVFDSVGEATAVAALAGCEPTLMNRLIAIYPRARSERLRRAIANLGPTRLSDVDAAQAAVAAAARDLENLGRLSWLGGARNQSSTESSDSERRIAAAA